MFIDLCFNLPFCFSDLIDVRIVEFRMLDLESNILMAEIQTDFTAQMAIITSGSLQLPDNHGRIQLHLVLSLDAVFNPVEDAIFPLDIIAPELINLINVR